MAKTIRESGSSDSEAPQLVGTPGAEIDHTLFAALGDPLLIIDLETGVIVDANPAACHAYGYCYEELVGLEAAATVADDSLAQLEECRRAAQTGRRHEGRAAGRRKDGTRLVEELRAATVQFQRRPHLLLARREVTGRPTAAEGAAPEASKAARPLGMSRQIASTLSVGPLLTLILRQLGTVVDYVGAGIALADDGDLVIVEYVGPFPRQNLIGFRLSGRAEGGLPRCVAEVVRRREPVIVNELSSADPLPAAIRAAADPGRVAPHYHFSWMGVPLIVEDRLLGSLWLDHPESNHFTAEHARLALGVAEQAAVAIENARRFEDEQRRAEQFHLIAEVGNQITSILNVEELLNQTAHAIRDTFGYHHVHLGLVEGDELNFSAAAGVWGEDSACYHCEDVRPRVGRDGVTGWVAGTGEALVVPDISLEPRYIPVLEDLTGSEVALPLKVRGRVLGVLDVESDQLDAFDEIDVAVLQSLADQVAVAIENARLFEAEQRSADRFRLISELGQHINAILDVDELIGRAVHLIQETFGFYHVHVGLLEGNVVHMPSTAGVWEDESGCSHCATLELQGVEDAICSRVAATGTPLLVTDISREPAYLHPTGAVGSGVVVPLQAKGKVIGLLHVEHREVDAFDDFDVAVLQLLANQVAVAIENGRLYRQAQSLAALQERQKLARELHDSVSQALYAISLGSHTARALLERDPQAAAEPLDYVVSLADAGLAEMRALIFELRPESLATEGLVAALAKQADALQARHGLAVHAELAEEPAARLEVKEALYRIAQEAMHNTVKHARASRLDLALRETGSEIVLELQDDGIGFDPAGSFPGHLGLQGMRERVARLGGEIDVQSAPGRGTTVRAALPLAAAA